MPVTGLMRVHDASNWTAVTGLANLQRLLAACNQALGWGVFVSMQEMY